MKTSQNNSIKRIITCIFIMLLMSGYCQANNNTDGLSCDVFKTYQIDEKGTLKVTSTYQYFNRNYDKTLREDLKLSFTTRFYSPNKEEINYIFVSCPNIDPEFEYSKSPLYSSQYDYETRFSEFDDIFGSLCFLDIAINYGKLDLPPESLIKIYINLMMNNVSINNEDRYEIFISPRDYELSDSSKTKEYNSFNLRVDLPNNPYYTSYYIDSTTLPTTIAPKGSGDSLFWDYCPQTDIVISYRLVENPIPKKIDGLIEETNLISKQAKDSSYWALGLGTLSFIIASFSFMKIDYKKMKSYIADLINKKS